MWIKTQDGELIDLSCIFRVQIQGDDLDGYTLEAFILPFSSITLWRGDRHEIQAKQRILEDILGDHCGVSVISLGKPIPPLHWPQKGGA